MRRYASAASHGGVSDRVDSSASTAVSTRNGSRRYPDGKHSSPLPTEKPRPRTLKSTLGGSPQRPTALRGRAGRARSPGERTRAFSQPQAGEGFVHYPHEKKTRACGCVCVEDKRAGWGRRSAHCWCSSHPKAIRARVAGRAYLSLTGVVRAIQASAHSIFCMLCSGSCPFAKGPRCQNRFVSNGIAYVLWCMYTSRGLHESYVA